MKKPVILMIFVLLILPMCLNSAASAETSDFLHEMAVLPESVQMRAMTVMEIAIPTDTPKPTIQIMEIALPTATPKPTFKIMEIAIPTATPKPTDKPSKTTKPQKTTKPTLAPKATLDAGQVFTSFGLYWREVLPRVTEEWFMVTPLDLSADGEQIYPLVASGTLIVGQVRLTIAGGTVRVDCEMIDGVQVLSEFLTFFPDLDSVKTLSLPLLSRQNYPFRSPISVRSTFGEDRLVLMYINNSVAFDPALPGLSRFDEELYRPWMQDMLTLLD